MSKMEKIIKRIDGFLSENKQVAKTILDQLGGNKFIAMTGARNFVYSAKEKSLSFRIGKNSKGINLVSIALMPSDLYEMKFFKVRGANVKKMQDVEGLLFDQLQAVFKEHTGMNTHL